VEEYVLAEVEKFAGNTTTVDSIIVREYSGGKIELEEMSMVLGVQESYIEVVVLELLRKKDKFELKHFTKVGNLFTHKSGVMLDSDTMVMGKVKTGYKETIYDKTGETRKILVGDVEAGMLVQTFNKGKITFEPIIATHRPIVPIGRQLTIEVYYEHVGISTNTVSLEHPCQIYVGDKPVFVKAEDITVGNKMIGNNEYVGYVTSVGTGDKDENFIDFTVRNCVKEDGCYYAGEDIDLPLQLIHNTRKGSIAVYTEMWSSDIKDFLDLKKNSGEERRRTHDLYPAVWVSDIFMERVEADEEWALFNPEDVKELSETYGDEFNKLYLEYEKNENIMKETVRAKDLWKIILRSYYETGSPFITFKDTFNRANPNKHDGLIRSSNLCVTGDTYLATDKGLITARELFEDSRAITATVDNRTSNMLLDEFGTTTAQCDAMSMTAINEKIFKITLTNGQVIKSTAWHKYYVKIGSTVTKKPLEHLAKGDVLLLQSDIGNFGSKDMDGEDLANRYFISSNFPEELFTCNRRTIISFLSSLLSKLTTLKNEESLDITFDDNITDFSKLQILLSNCGIVSNNIPDLLIIDNDNFRKLTSFINGAETLINNIVYNEYEASISDIVYIGKEDVYDTTQHTSHSLIFNGIVTGNCTEIGQNTSPNHYTVRLEFEDGQDIELEEDTMITTKTGVVKQAGKVTSIDTVFDKKVRYTEYVKHSGDTAVCNLASVNLSRVNTKDHIEKVVPIAVRMLDNVIDLNFYPIKSIADTARKTRAIGLGVMGEAQMLADSKIMFDTIEGRNKIDNIMEMISFNTIKASADLARKYGQYSIFEGSNWSKGILPFDLVNDKVRALTNCDNVYSKYEWDELAEYAMGGMRNGYLMAIAPTSSISIICGTTQAIEPVYKRKWFEENMSGLTPVTAPNISPDNWVYYKTAYDMSQLDLIYAGAVRQKWIDQGQSLNIFVTNDKATGRYLNEIYTTAWKYGAKATYYLRSESPSTEVMDRSQECVGCQ
jgi:ribonucleotide reductase alpha subunit